MNIHRTAFGTCLLVMALLPSPAAAERRVIAPPGVKVEEKKPEDEARKAEEAKKAEEARKAEEDAAKAEEAKKAQSIEEKIDSKRPVAAPEAARKEELPPPPPKILVPRDESPVKGPAKPAVAASKAAPEVLYRKKVDRAIVTLRVRPAKPEPGRSTTLIFELVRLLRSPDPVLGDRMPEENAIVFATVTREGGKPTRFHLHPLKNAGTYGMHFTAPDAGPYRVALTQVLPNAEIGDVPIATEFVLGIGQETPMEAAEDEGAVKASRGRTALKAFDPKRQGATDAMHELGERWVALSALLDDPKSAPADLLSAAKACEELSAKVSGGVPMELASSTKEFDGLAADLKARVESLATASADRSRAREVMQKAEGTCNRCHVKFRWNLTDDLSDWPKFTARAPKAQDKRH